MKEGLDGVAERWVTARQQAQALDGGAADDVALVFAELPEDLGGEADLPRCSGGARGDEAEMPACPRFVDRHLGESGGDLGCVGSEELSLFLSDAAGDIGGADALLWIRGGECGDKLTREAAMVRLSKEAPRLRASDGESPAGGLHEIVFHRRTCGRHGIASGRG